MAKVNLSVHLDCPCGHCSSDLVEVAVHLASCKEIDKLPKPVADWIKSVVEVEIAKLR